MFPRVRTAGWDLSRNLVKIQFQDLPSFLYASKRCSSIGSHRTCVRVPEQPSSFSPEHLSRSTRHFRKSTDTGSSSKGQPIFSTAVVILSSPVAAIPAVRIELRSYWTVISWKWRDVLGTASESKGISPTLAAFWSRFWARTSRFSERVIARGLRDWLG